MKKAALLLALLSAAYCVCAKTTVYCEIVHVRVDARQTTYIDFGTSKNQERPTGVLVDADGNQITFTGKIDALNKMARLGWKLAEIYTDASGKGNEEKYCYMILSKEVEEGEPIERYVTKREFQKLKK